MVQTTAQSGLSSKEAKLLLKKYGENVVVKKKKISPILALIRKFNSPLLLVLIFAGLISFFVGERVNGSIILFMVFASGLIDFANSFQSEKAVDKLVNKITSTATVIRNGKEKEVPLKHIVPGDLVMLSAGDIVPADCRLTEVDNFFINQSTLTGEAFPIEEAKGNSIFMGTSVVAGFAKAIVEKTGFSTEFGKIAQKLESAPPETDFEKNLRNFSIFILRLIFFMVCVVFLANILLSRKPFDSFLFAIAIAVGLTPELLPIIMSVSLSRGSLKMAKKDVIVKNLSSIESFGSMDILCTDKTGTLTQNKITLVKYVDFSGTSSDKVLLYTYLSGTLHSGVKDIFDNAIREYKKMDTSEYEKVDELPFDFARKRESLVVSHKGKRTMLTKGAPEEILKISSHYLTDEKTEVLNEDVKNRSNATYTSLSADGFRVLGIAIKEVDVSRDNYKIEDEKEMTFFGFVAFLDPPKKDAKETIEKLKALGIDIKILTGDSEILTEKICREIDIKYENALTGNQLSLMSDAELEKVVEKTTIFARILPEQKEKVILILKKLGHVVGYLGDGINDAPSIKAADVGISVNNAVDVAKETADIILLRKSLSVLKEGIIEGRKTLQNTMKYIMMGLSSNFGNMFSMMGASLILPFLPMLPTQILLNNLLYDASQLSLSTDSVDEDSIRKPPRWNLDYIKRFMYVFGPISSVFDFFTFGVLIYFFKLTAPYFQAGWFMESIATQILVIYLIRTKKLPFIESRPSALLFFNTSLIVIFAWILPFTFLGKIFGFRKIDMSVTLAIAGIVAMYLLVVEFSKRYFFRKIIARAI